MANSRVVVMFVNEDNSRGILRALKKSNRTSELSFLASDSWGAKIHPVFEQEVAAESAVTILPKRKKIKGQIFHIGSFFCNNLNRFLLFLYFLIDCRYIYIYILFYLYKYIHIYIYLLFIYYIFFIYFYI